MRFAIVTDSRQRDELLFMVDRNKQRASFWSNRLDDVFWFSDLAAATRKANSFKFNNPRVMTEREARSIERESEFMRIHEEAMDACEAGWDGHKDLF